MTVYQTELLTRNQVEFFITEDGEEMSEHAGVERDLVHVVQVKLQVGGQHGLLRAVVLDVCLKHKAHIMSWSFHASPPCDKHRHDLQLQSCTHLSNIGSSFMIYDTN